MTPLQVTYEMRVFDDHGTFKRGSLCHEGGTHVCYFHGKPEHIPPRGTYQLCFFDAPQNHFVLRNTSYKMVAVGSESGIELGKTLHADRVANHGSWIIDFLVGLHHARDAKGVATFVEVM